MLTETVIFCLHLNICYLPLRMCFLHLNLSYLDKCYLHLGMYYLHLCYLNLCYLNLKIHYLNMYLHSAQCNLLHQSPCTCTCQTLAERRETGCWWNCSTRCGHHCGVQRTMYTVYLALCQVDTVKSILQVLMPQMKIWFGWKIGQGPEHREKVS